MFRGLYCPWVGGLLGVLVMEQQYFIIQASLVPRLTISWWVESQRKALCFGFNRDKSCLGLLVGNHIVNASILMSYKSVCGVSYRLISTGQLHESLVLASTSGLSTQWSAGSLSHLRVWKSHLEAGFPLRCFQRLSHPNVANQRCTWQYN